MIEWWMIIAMALTFAAVHPLWWVAHIVENNWRNTLLFHGVIASAGVTIIVAIISCIYDCIDGVC